MFDFFSKLVSRRPRPAHTDARSSLNTVEEQKKVIQFQSAEQLRQDYLRKIEQAVIGQASEQQFFQLMVDCDFAEGRLKAAENLHTQAMLERALMPMRKVDKRVSRLLQLRLDHWQEKEKTQQAAQALINQIDHLLSQNCVYANQMIEIDKQSASIAGPSNLIEASLRETLESKLASLQSKLAQQVELQSRLLSLSNELDHALHHLDRRNPERAQELQSKLDQVLSEQAIPAISKSLISECQQKMQHFRDVVEQCENDTRLASQVSASTSADIDESSKQILISPLEEVPIDSATIQRKTVQANLNSPLSLTQIEETLVKLEEAIAAGRLQLARQFEKDLREIDPKQKYDNVVLRRELRERLNMARKELGRLNSWAKWGGGVSREELVDTAEKLKNLKLAPKEIVETVSALREQWKQMDLGTPGAAKELWLRFDTACNAVYAPAAEFFQSQSEQRRVNQALAEAKLIEFAKESANLLCEPIDWKKLSNYVMSMRDGWREIGPLDRKEKSRLDQQYNELYLALRRPLETRQTEEIATREKIIDEIQQIDPVQKSAIDQVKSLQQKWQMQATSFTLPRRVEQKLWEQFRLACDKVFEHKRRHSESADRQRQENLNAKEALCLALSEFASNEVSVLREQMQKANVAWRDIGPVPRAFEQNIELDFKKQLLRLQNLIHDVQTQEMKQIRQQLVKAFEHCLKIDQTVEKMDDAEERLPRLLEQWQEFDSIPGHLKKALDQRVANVAKLRAAEYSAYARRLADNVQVADDLCLHLEIAMAIESPPEFTQNRLKKQVEVLQMALRHGDAQQKINSLMSDLVSLPFSTDRVRQQRVTVLLSKIEF
ncbi:DUF349 domain-containing protein [Undibacterium fentianense]|uniref:DUF349 domain-containing protein n=1 Tax=Undibacterium fentianense TaxID=2828728 RepID=A0A941E272_9BURK|nr:DUF349 domain-containing protein [Undibacterium fentianense]MBR7800031.1 DUF349 domain-containing protein [Undibacterium fentianense]